MADNRVVVYRGPGEVAVEDIDYPKLEVPEDVASVMGMTKKAPHGVILKTISTNMCGSDLHMVRGRTTALPGQTLGHEFTGQVIEKGADVQFLDVGDICFVAFNVACGRCRNCKERKTGVCLNVNPDPARAGSAYGYVDMGGWQGGQADYVMVPFADFNLLKFPDSDQALEKIRDLTMLSDIFPTGYHGAHTAGVTPGSTVYVAGAGPVGLAAAYSAHLRSAAVVIVGDRNEERLAQARSFGCETVNVGEDAALSDQIAEIVGEPEVDCAVDAVGYEASGRGGEEAPAVVLNQIQSVTRAGGSLGIQGMYVTDDPGASDPDAQQGTLKICFGLGWAKSHAFYPGPSPVMKYYRELMMSILYDKAHIANAVNATVFPLEEAPQAYEAFDKGAAVMPVFDPHTMFSRGGTAAAESTLSLGGTAVAESTLLEQLEKERARADRMEERAEQLRGELEYRKTRADSTATANGNIGPPTDTKGRNMAHRESTGALILNEGPPVVSLIGGGALLGSMIGAAVAVLSPVAGGVVGGAVGTALAGAHIAAHIYSSRKNQP